MIWKIDYDGNRIIANDDRETIICLMSASLRNPDVLKDARLIAAAPELLEALKWVSEHSYAGGKSFGDLDIVKNAIAKATGEQ